MANSQIAGFRSTSSNVNTVCTVFSFTDGWSCRVVTDIGLKDLIQRATIQYDNEEFPHEDFENIGALYVFWHIRFSTIFIAPDLKIFF